MGIKISAIVCTHNRSAFVGKAIKSLVEQVFPKDEYEIIVVDNGSTDDTKSEIKKVRNDFLIKYVYEGKLGLSRARNRGVKEARGKIVAFLDDDAEADPDWLENISSKLKTVTPVPGCVSGKILPIWEGSPPEWLDKRLEGQLALQDWGESARVIAKDMWFAGASVAYPKELLERIGGFDEELGRVGSNLLSMEENLVREKLEGLGFFYYYDPTIVVRHHIKKDRLTKKWFLERAYWNGMSEAILNRKLQPVSPAFRCAKTIWVMLRMIFSIKDLRGLFLSAEKKDNFYAKCSVLARLGYIRGLFKRGIV